ncbi:type I secretion system permease/ATPase [Pelagibacterium luteolum]|nr:type I secretion system permease/ATPase [Pelagibacterium luteolum]
MRLRGPFVVLVGMSAISNILMLAGPIFMLQIYDRVLTSRSIPTLVVLTAMVCFLYLYYAVIEALRSRMMMRIAAVIDLRIAPALFSAMAKTASAGGAAGGPDAVRDGDTLRGFLSGSGPLALLDLPWLPAYLAIIFVMHPDLGWLATIGALVILVLMLINEFATRGPTAALGEASMRRQRFLDGVRANGDAVNVMGMVGPLQGQRKFHQQSVLSALALATDRGSAVSSLIRGLRYLLQSGVLALGALLVIEGQLSPGLMIAASIITARALAPVDQLVGQWRGLLMARQALARIRAVLASDKRGAGLGQMPVPAKAIVVQNLASGPKGSRVPLVTGLQFELKAGDGMGIVGPTASGKSGVAKSMVGLWSGMLGTLRLDGAAIESFPPEQLGGIVGYLPQAFGLLDGSIGDNIARFSASPDTNAIIAAAQLVGVHEMIVSLPDKYDTRIEDAGERLSLGQRQRIGIARAFYGDPFLIVLDEPHAHLDADGDIALTRAIRAARERGAIVVVAANRPGALEAMDKVLVLQKGRQIAFGPKEQVLAPPAKPVATVLKAVGVPAS